MASSIRTFQERVAALILADTEHFVAAPAPDGDTRVPVIVDLPGDIQTTVDKALAATGIAVIVWTPSRLPKNEQRAKNRRYVCRVWAKENVLLNRGQAGQLARDVTTNEAGDTISTAMDSTGLSVGMPVASADFPPGTTITQIDSPGAEAFVHFSEGKLTTGTSVGVVFGSLQMTAEEAAELIDELCDGKSNGLTAHPVGKLGGIALGDAGIVPIGGEDAESNDFEITLETEALL